MTQRDPLFASTHAPVVRDEGSQVVRRSSTKGTLPLSLQHFSATARPDEAQRLPAHHVESCCSLRTLFGIPLRAGRAWSPELARGSAERKVQSLLVAIPLWCGPHHVVHGKTKDPRPKNEEIHWSKASSSFRAEKRGTAEGQNPSRS